jgi:hypothetical protein
VADLAGWWQDHAEPATGDFMLKKLVTAVIAGAFATALAAPAVMACPGKDTVANKEDKASETKTAAKEKAKKPVKPEKVKSKTAAKKVINKG